MKPSLALLICSAFMLLTSARAFSECTCSSQICLATEESALYLACVITSPGATSSVKYDSSLSALFNAIGKLQTAQFFTTCSSVTAPLLPALQGQNTFQTGAAMSSAAKVYAKKLGQTKRDAWRSFVGMSTAECLSAAKTIP
jgi:hypothetical protein